MPDRRLLLRLLLLLLLLLAARMPPPTSVLWHGMACVRACVHCLARSLAWPRGGAASFELCLPALPLTLSLHTIIIPARLPNCSAPWCPRAHQGPVSAIMPYEPCYSLARRAAPTTSRMAGTAIASVVKSPLPPSGTPSQVVRALWRIMAGEHVTMMRDDVIWVRQPAAGAVSLPVLHIRLHRRQEREDGARVAVRAWHGIDEISRHPPWATV